MGTVVIKKNGKFFGLGKEDGGETFIDFNDPSDAWDYLINFAKMPSEMFIRKNPDFGWSWDDLPFKFGWKGDIYEVYAHRE